MGTGPFKWVSWRGGTVTLYSVWNLSALGPDKRMYRHSFGTGMTATVTEQCVKLMRQFVVWFCGSWCDIFITTIFEAHQNFWSNSPPFFPPVGSLRVSIDLQSNLNDSYSICKSHMIYSILLLQFIISLQLFEGSRTDVGSSAASEVRNCLYHMQMTAGF